LSVITLWSGKSLDLLNPDPAVMDLDVIAQSLSKLCRYTGQCLRFYSVAEHSVRASYIDETLETLLHDAAEAFIGDVATPLKRLLPDYAIIEEKIEAAIAERYGLKWPWNIDVHNADAVMLVTEQRDLLPPGKPFNTLRPLDKHITMAPQPILYWRGTFIDRFHDLGGKL
jgi:hypothetical protein